MAVRPGTGKLVKFFRIGTEPMQGLMSEVEQLTDNDVTQLAAGIESGSLNY